MALYVPNSAVLGNRADLNLGAVAAGSGGASNKFVAFTNLLLFGLTAVQTVLGSSTYSGTASGQQLYVVYVVNTGTNTNTLALSTTSIGPFLAGGQGTTAQVGGVNQWAINTNTGTAGQGGVLIPALAQVYVISGTDATAQSVVTIDYQLAPGAAVTI